MTTSLKPCPFCGEHAHMKELETAHGSTLYGVSCPTEGCLGFAMETYFDTPDEAVKAWNRRFDRTCRVVRMGEPSPTGVPKARCCSECGGRLTRFGVFCPSCGAKVIGDEDAD